MKITSLDIKGFRSLKNTHWAPNHLNVVIGPNGAGKSNLLRFLELITISAQASLGKYIQSLGGMDPLVWDGQVSNIICKLKMSSVDEEKQQDASLIYELELARLGYSSAYRIGQERLINEKFITMDDKPISVFLERNQSKSLIFVEKDNALKTLEESISEEESLLSMAATPFTANRLMARFQRQLASWKIYHLINLYYKKPSLKKMKVILSFRNRFE